MQNLFVLVSHLYIESFMLSWVYWIIVQYKYKFTVNLRSLRDGGKYNRECFTIINYYIQHRILKYFI